MGKPSKFEESGSGKKAKVKIVEKPEPQDNPQAPKDAKPEEINIMSLFHLIQETAREQRDNIKRIEDNLEKNHNLLKEQNEKFSKDMDMVREDVRKHNENIQVLNIEVQTLKDNVDPAKVIHLEEETKSARCLAERNANVVDENKGKIEELQTEMEKLTRINTELRADLNELKTKGTNMPSIPQEPRTLGDINAASHEESTRRPPQPEQSHLATNIPNQKKTFAQILLEEKSRRSKALRRNREHNMQGNQKIFMAW